jgi:LysR family transcriptional regulator, transcriptional activator of nhaA
MRHLNYNHLYYFWTVAREGSIKRASEILHLTPQTISGQLKLLEESVGEPLFNRVGRRLVLSDSGKVVKQYADEIFSLGAELANRVRDKSAINTLELNVGIVNSIAKLIAYQLVSPALAMEESFRVICHESKLEDLLADLSIHQLDLVLSDRPMPIGLGVKAFNHFLGVSPVSFFAAESIASGYQKNFPESLDNAPVLLPLKNSPLRLQLDEWFDEKNLHPRIIAEFEDSALLKAFGSVARGIFPAPKVISKEIEAMYNAVEIGSVPQISESFYAISHERKLKHSAVSIICEKAKLHLY